MAKAGRVGVTVVSLALVHLQVGRRGGLEVPSEQREELRSVLWIVQEMGRNRRQSGWREAGLSGHLENVGHHSKSSGKPPESFGGKEQPE